LGFSGSDIYAPEKAINVPLPSSPSKLEIVKSGPGRLYYNTMLTFFRRLMPDDAMADKSLPRGIHLKRGFFRMTPDKVAENGSVHFSTNPLANGTVKAGETILMKVYLETPISLPYVILEVPLPSGGEVAVDDPRQSQAETDEGSDFIGNWGPWWWTHQDVLDDKIVFFVTNLSAGKSEFHTMVRMEMPGSFNMNPINLEGMYTKRIRPYSPIDSLRVVE